MDLNDLTCRAYLGIRELKIAEIFRRILGVKRPTKRLLRVLLPGKPVWVQVRSGMSQGMWREMLRAHIHRTLLQVAKIAGMDEIPGLVGHMSNNGHWQLEAYMKPKALTEGESKLTEK